MAGSPTNEGFSLLFSPQSYARRYNMEGRQQHISSAGMNDRMKCPGRTLTALSNSHFKFSLRRLTKAAQRKPRVAHSFSVKDAGFGSSSEDAGPGRPRAEPDRDPHATCVPPQMRSERDPVSSAVPCPLTF